MIKRQLYDDLKAHLDKPEISLVVGPRQAGKTTLLRLLQEDLKRQGGRTTFLNLDIETDKAYFYSQDALLRRIELEIGGGKGFVFIDEIQRKENAGVFLKGIYDMNLPYKFIVSGSGSLELKEKIHESLAGRKRMFELSTLSFREFVNFKTDNKYEDRLDQFFGLEKTRTLTFLEEYLNFGGYPKVVLSQTLDEKRQAIAEIYQSYLERDISYLLGVGKSESFTQLVRLLSSQIGNIVNVSELSSTLGLSAVTVKNYLWYLEKTFLVSRITPFFKNIRSEITKSPIYYFDDLGLRNFALGEFGNATRTSSAGFLFQNFILNLLKGHLLGSAAEVHFWRTKDRAEVDFVLDYVQKVVPIEVKYSKLEKPEMSRSFNSFIEKYHSPVAGIVNLRLRTEIRRGETTVFLVPFDELIGNLGPFALGS